MFYNNATEIINLFINSNNLNFNNYSELCNIILNNDNLTILNNINLKTTNYTNFFNKTLEKNTITNDLIFTLTNIYNNHINIINNVLTINNELLINNNTINYLNLFISGNCDLNLLNYTNTLDSITDNTLSLYTYSVPNLKLYYPEPFIATGNFLHGDFWFIHITIYQYWLWFFFIYLIIFFIICFLVTLRWNQLRNKPQRETRGVSRSKCGDLITAAVPVTWAGSIIIHESTDAIDFYDGFGTSEMAVGIRAYQWGWEYYYPKDIDISYNTTNFNNSFIGNSLYYTTEIEESSRGNLFFENYKTKHKWDASITPAHLICFSTKFSDRLNLVTSKTFGYSKMIKQNTFKHILSNRYINYNLTLNIDNFSNKFLNDNYVFKLFDTTEKLITSPELSRKEYEYISPSTLFKFHSTFNDLTSLKKYIELNSLKKKNINLNIKLLSNNLFFSNNLLLEIFKLNIFFKNNFYTKNDINSNKIINDLLYTWKKRFYKFNYSIDSIWFNLTNLFDKNYNNMNKNNNVNFNNLNINFKKFTLDSEYLVLNNLIKILPNNNLYSYNLTLNNKLNFITKNNLDYYKYINLNWSNWYILKQLNTTSNIYSINKTPFKQINLNNNWAPILNFNKNNTLYSSAENWNNDYYNMDSIIKLTKFNFKNIKLYHQFNTIFSWTFNDILLPNQYSELDSKRNLLMDSVEDYIWEDEYDIEYYQQQYEYLLQLLDLYENKNYTHTDLTIHKNLNTFLSSTEFNKQNINKVINLSDFNQIFILNNSNNTNLFDLNLNLNLNLNTLIIDNYGYLYLISTFNNVFDNSFFLYKELSMLLNSFNINTKLIYNFNNFLNEIQLICSKFWLDYENPYFNNTHVNKLFKTKYNTSGIKFNFNYSLVDSIKQLLTTDSSVLKFYRAVFDENRSFTNFLNFSNSYVKLPHINHFNSSYKKYINKNYISFVKSNLYLFKNKIIINNINNTFHKYNIFTFDFPFAIANESDVLKYSWFDWYSNYNKITARQQDISDYLVNGTKIYKNKYDYTKNLTFDYNIKDNYINRLSNSRKNYSTNWNFIPFGLTRLKYWNSESILLNNLKITTILNDNNFLEYSRLKFWLIFMRWYETLLNNIFIYNPSTSILSNSNIYSPNKNYLKTTNTLSSYSFFITYLTDILSKREYIFKQICNNYKLNNNILPNYSISNYNNILTLWKSSLLKNTIIEKNLVENYYFYNTNLIYIFTNYISWYKTQKLYNMSLSFNQSSSMLNELDLWYNLFTRNSLNFFLYNIIDNNLKIMFNEFNNMLNYTNTKQYWNKYYLLYTHSWFFQHIIKKTPIELEQYSNSLRNNFIYELTSLTKLNLFNIKFNVIDLLENIKSNYNVNTDKIFFKKSQYKHMRKSVSNMIRIQNDKAVAMPVDTRIQFVTVSKDIIHSWAIPSAGIKIDCIPGYSSHKVTIFFLSGIYWGQCMEICGRYHHWMPIVVYFIKRDLFLLWCIHFISVNKTNIISSRQITKNNTDNMSLVSYPLSSWILELKK